MLTGLQTLDCCYNQLTSLEPLRACAGLRELNCQYNSLTSLEPLRALTGLQTLNCGGNQLTSLEGLQGCTGLQSLDCHYNPLTSLEPLRALTGLQTLNCGGNQLTSLEGLQGCTGLQSLDCHYNPLTSLEPLRVLTGLRTLNCHENRLTSLEGLRACPGLQTLDCSQNPLTSLEPLLALTGLQYLKCDLNQLTSLEPLRACSGLQTLNCGRNQLTSLEGLQTLTGLQNLYCDGNQLTSLEGLQACPGLQNLYCNNNQLTSLEGLQACPGLRTLKCGSNQLTSLEPLRACPGLQTLDCQSNQLTSLEGLQGCTGLQTLDCDGNQLTSLEPLHGLKSGLMYLDCKRNPSLSVQEIERFQKAMPSCRISPTANDLRDIERKKIEVAKNRGIAKIIERLVTAKLGINKIVPANNHFGFRLFDQLLQQDLGQNVFMSPLSVAIALAMTYNGAAGNTQTVMAKTLGLENLSLAEVNKANLALRNVLLHQSNVSLLIANSLWLNQNFHLEPTFLTPTQKFYAANVTNADFQSPATVSDINQWVDENTQGKIGPVVQTLNPLTVLLIINAIYFKGKWEKPFNKENTKERDFTLLTGENKRIPMMFQTDDYSYYEGNNYQAVRLPYKASKKPSLSMTVFLPSRGIPLESFPLLDHWQEWRAGNTSREGSLVLPRFKVEYEVTLNGALKALGMAEAFSVEDADFSQMAKVPTGWNLYISEVKHQTFVEVNEEGTEAAAVTVVLNYNLTCQAKPIPPFKMIVDHPFLFTIQDEDTGTVLFLGAIVEPK